LAEFAAFADNIEKADSADDNDACVLHNAFGVRDAEKREQQRKAAPR
jgi:hypothetical protein